MRTLMFVLSAALVFPATIGVVAPQRARAQAPVEAGVKEGAPGKEELSSDLPQKIVVTSPLATDVVVTQKYFGRIRSQRHIEVRSPSTGHLEFIPAREGQEVKKGDVLFKLAPTLYQAKLDAELAAVQVAQIELANTKKLPNNKVVSENDVRLSEAKLAKAKAQAKVAQAELDLLTIRAPFDGLLGRLEIQEGSQVNQGDGLTTLSDNRVMWVYFSVPERNYLEYMTDRNQQRKEDSQIELILASDRKFPQTGKIGAIEADFNNETGNIAFRADFPNPDGLLRHGQTATVLLHRTVKNAIVIPGKATFEIAGRRYVYVVGNDGVARQREVAVQHELDAIVVIKNGLDASDRIVLEAFRRFGDVEKSEYEFRKPEEAFGVPHKGRHK